MSVMMIPALQYRDAPAAIAWLSRAFGFREQMVVEDGAGGIAHAQLTLGDGMIMLGSSRDNDYGRLLVPPAQAGGVTQAPYIVIDDADAIYATAKAAGAEILIDIADQGHGGRAFTCRDPEGHVWNFGTYDPRG